MSNITEHSFPFNANLTPSGFKHPDGRDTPMVYALEGTNFIIRKDMPVSLDAYRFENYWEDRAWQQFQLYEECLNNLQQHDINVLPHLLFAGQDDGYWMYVLTHKVKGEDLKSLDLIDSPEVDIDPLLTQFNAFYASLCNVLEDAMVNEKPYVGDIFWTGHLRTGNEQFMYGTYKPDQENKIWLVDFNNAIQYHSTDATFALRDSYYLFRMIREIELNLCSPLEEAEDRFRTLSESLSTNTIKLKQRSWDDLKKEAFNKLTDRLQKPFYEIDDWDIEIKLG